MSPPLTWSIQPGLLAALGAYLLIYALRWRRARVEAGARAASGWRLASFWSGVLMLFIGLASPIDGLGERLFVFHMAQHIFLTDLAAILLLLGLTKVILRPLTGRLGRLERAAGPLAHPVFAVLVYAGTLWVWHIPALYQLGLNNPALHPLQHLSLAAAALLFWWYVLSPVRSRQRLAGMGVVFYIAGAKVLTGVLASVITWAPGFLYDHYARQPRYLGLSAEEDQALAGAVMMAEQALVLTVAVVLLFVRMLGESEREQQRRERFELG
jgi:putative membrane protein